MNNTLQSLGTIVPQRMASDYTHATSRLVESVGGSIENFVCNALCWTNKELYARLSKEQVEAVANIIYNFEARHEATIIGDQTGGGSGLPFSSELPIGWSVRFSASPYYDARMKQIEFGIEPDIYVTLDDVLAVVLIVRKRMYVR